MANQNIASPITNEQNFTATINSLIENPQRIEKVASEAKKYVQLNIGATKKILGEINPKIKGR